MITQRVISSKETKFHEYTGWTITMSCNHIRFVANNAGKDKKPPKIASCGTCSLMDLVAPFPPPPIIHYPNGRMELFSK